MCGIVGVVGDINYKEKKAFKRLLELDTARGPHSTGVVSLDFKSEIQFDKQVGTPWDFYEKSWMIDNSYNINGISKMLIGHNRWATQGAVNKDNAHPFNFERVIGVHNGTINCGRSLSFLREKGGDHAVDSHMLYESINNIGLKETITNIEGAWSLAWYDKNEKTLNLFRNEKRPMYYAYIKGRKTLFFASESWMIGIACATNGLEYEGIHETKADHHYIIDVTANTYPNGLDLRYYKEKIEGKKFPSVVITYHNAPFSSGIVGNNVKTESKRPAYEAVNNSLNDKNGLCPVYFDKERSKYINPVYSGAKYSKVVLYTLREDRPVHVYIDSEKHKGLDIHAKLRESQGWFYTTLNGGYYMSGSDEYIALSDYDKLSEEKSWNELADDLWEDLCNEGKVEEEEELYRVYGGELVNRSTFHDRVSEGCGYCTTNDIDPNDANEIIWVSEKDFVCPHCAKTLDRHNISLYGGF